MKLMIADMSQSSGFAISLFANKKPQLPEIEQGQIILLHAIKVYIIYLSSFYSNNEQVKSLATTSWGVGYKGRWHWIGFNPANNDSQEEQDEDTKSQLFHNGYSVLKCCDEEVVYCQQLASWFNEKKEEVLTAVPDKSCLIAELTKDFQWFHATVEVSLCFPNPCLHDEIVRLSKWKTGTFGSQTTLATASSRIPISTIATFHGTAVFSKCDSSMIAKRMP